MSFGISAATWVAIGVGTAAVGTAAYSADQQRKAMHKQQDALKAAQEADARQAAEAETKALVAANAQTADAGRRRRASALGGFSSDSLGTPSGGALAAGAAASRAGAAYYRGGASGGSASGSATVSALGAGAPAATIGTRPVNNRTSRV